MLNNDQVICIQKLPWTACPWELLYADDLGPELQCLLKVKEDLIVDISTCYIRCLIKWPEQCSTCGQRYQCDLQKKSNYFDFNQFETLFFAS